MLKYILPITDLHDLRVRVQEHPRGTRSSAMHSAAGHVQLATDMHVSQIGTCEHSLGAQSSATVEKRRKEEHSRSKVHQSSTP